MAAMDTQTLADRLSISDYLTNYAAAVDRRDWDLYRSLFTEDAHIDYESAGGEKGNVDEIIAFLDKSMALFEMSQHMITNEEVKIDGDTATVRAMFVNPMRFVGGETFFTCGGWYNHKLVRSDDGWKSQELIEETAWSEGM